MATKYYNVKVKSGVWIGYILDDGKVGQPGTKKRFTKAAANKEAVKRSLGSRYLQFWSVPEGE